MHADTMTTSAPRVWRGRAWLLVAMFAIVVIVRLWYVHRYAAAVPFWDQWDGEADDLLKPWMDGTFSLGQLWIRHNEHRILPTRIEVLLLYLCTGEWNNLHAARFNVLLSATCATALAAVVAWQSKPTGLRWMMLPVVLAGFVLPFGWENTLTGFQSQFYYLVVFMLAATACATYTRVRAVPMLAVIAACALSILTMASGLITPLAVAALLAIDRRTGESRLLKAGSILLLVAIAAVAYTTIPQVPGHAGMRATGALDFLDAATRALAWPWVNHRWAALVLWMPGLLGALIVAARRDAARTDVFMAGLCIWSGAQALAMAYARGHGILEIAPRYGDLLVPGLIANAWFTIRLLERAPVGTWKAYSAALAACLFFVVYWGGNLRRVGGDMEAMRSRGAMSALQSTNVFRYLATGNPADLLQPPMQIPYPDPKRLQMLLDHQGLRAALSLPGANNLEHARTSPVIPPPQTPAEAH